MRVRVDNVSIFNTAEVARTTASDQKTSKIVGSKQQVLNVSCSPSCSGVLFPGVNCKNYRGEKSCPSLFEVSSFQRCPSASNKDTQLNSMIV